MRWQFSVLSHPDGAVVFIPVLFPRNWAHCSNTWNSASLWLVLRSPRGFTARSLRWVMWRSAYIGVSTTNSQVTVHPMSSLVRLSFCLSMLCKVNPWCDTLHPMMWHVTPHDVTRYTPWCDTLHPMMWHVTPHDVTRYTPWCDTLHPTMSHITPHDVTHYTSWCDILPSKMWHVTPHDMTRYTPWCDTLHSMMWRVTLQDVTCYTPWCDMLQPMMWHITLQDVTCYTPWCDTLHPMMWHITLQDVTRYTPWCDMLQPIMWHVTLHNMTCYTTLISKYCSHDNSQTYHLGGHCKECNLVEIQMTNLLQMKNTFLISDFLQNLTNVL